MTERYEQHSFDIEGNLRTPRRIYTAQDIEALHTALAPFVDLGELRRLIAEGKAIHDALLTDAPPREVRALLDVVRSMLIPLSYEKITTPRDAAAIFMTLLGEKDQEELHTMALNTKNGVLGIHMVYRGSVNSAMIRIGEVFKEAIKQNATSVLICHNHPSGSIDHSPVIWRMVFVK